MTPRDETTPYAITIAGKRIYVYADDHGPPHAHVRLDNGKHGVVRFHVDTLDPLPNFHCTHKALQAWSRLRKHVTPYCADLHEAFDRLSPPSR